MRGITREPAWGVHSEILMSAITSQPSNQSTPLVDYDLFSSHSALSEALARAGAAAGSDCDRLMARVRER
jgi:hypothetical protein